MESGQWEELLARGRGPWEPQSWHPLPQASLVQALLCCATQGQFLTHAGPQPHVCKEGHWEGCFRGRGALMAAATFTVPPTGSQPWGEEKLWQSGCGNPAGV